MPVQASPTAKSRRAAYQPPAACPQVGQVIVFSVVPPSSYCSVGEAYRVTHGPRSPRDSFRFESVARGSATSDPVWAVQRAAWAEAA